MPHPASTAPAESSKCPSGIFLQSSSSGTLSFSLLIFHLSKCFFQQVFDPVSHYICLADGIPRNALSAGVTPIQHSGKFALTTPSQKSINNNIQII